MEIDAVLEVEAGDPQIAIDFLVANVNLSKSRLKDLMNKGGVWRVDASNNRQRIRRAMTDIFVGDQIEIFYDDRLLALKPLKATLLEDAGQYSVWNKPFGMPLNGSDWGDFHSFCRAVEMAFNPAREIFWLSALDYQATGLLILAHTRKAALAFADQLSVDGFEATARLHYRADVQGDYIGGESLDEPLDSASAVTQVKKVRYDKRPDRTIVDVWPQTGRTDQVVRHLAQAGFPVIGDERYADHEAGEGLRLRLVEMVFQCPVSGEQKHYSLVNE
jgi:tRNA pseudouridine32 synthase/23S rRNA pseudouridine746 synthase